MVGFTHQGDKDARTALSGGQCVTLALSFRFAAMEILNCPVPLLALDEPTQFLDTASREAMVDVIKSLTPLTEKGLTIQMATHESSLATAFHDELKFVRQY
jgi:DNA repair exonuclease SbcCD ATPase subunit